MCEKTNAFFELGGYGFIRFAVSRVEGLIVAVRAASKAFAAVAVGAGETGVQGNFLNFCFKVFVQKKLKLSVEGSGEHLLEFLGKNTQKDP